VRRTRARREERRRRIAKGGGNSSSPHNSKALCWSGIGNDLSSHVRIPPRCNSEYRVTPAQHSEPVGQVVV
jgi:hypothetical protein